jgi:hypothetical protein
MKPFDPKRKCEKCGHEGKKLVENDTVIVFRPAADTTYMTETDKLLRTCKRCGFQWLEQCVD